MRPTLTQLRCWNPGELDWRATELREMSGRLLLTGGRVAAGTRATDWTGVAAIAAADRVDRELAAATALADDWECAAAALRFGGDALAAAREQALAVADEAADVLGLAVDDAGRVGVPTPSWVGPGPVATLIGLVLAEVARARQARLSAALDAVDAADRALATALLGERGSAANPPAPPGDADEEGAARYWSSLTEAQRDRVLAEHPDWVGNLDGIPAADRDVANRAVLAARRRDLEGVLDGLRAQGADAVPVGRPGMMAREVRARLADIAALERAVAEPGRALLVYRGGDEIRAAVAVGDVDTADHVAVYTPGVNTTVDDLESKVAELDGLRSDAVTQLAAAGRTDEAAAGRTEGTAAGRTEGTAAGRTEGTAAGRTDETVAGRTDETVAAIVWLDYEPPQLSLDSPIDSVGDVVVDLAGGRAAREGAEALAGFCRGIVESRPDGVHLTAVGHSYGSTTTGLALQRGDIGVDEAVFLGSPGLGTDSVADLGLGAGHVYVAEAAGDRVADLGTYGSDPISMPGIVGLSTAAQQVDGQSLSGAQGHSEYLVEGGTSRHNVAAVVAGLGGNIVEGRDLDGGDGLSTSPLGRLLGRLTGP